MLSRMKLRDDAEIGDLFGKKDRVIDIIIDLSKRDWEEKERKKEVDKLYEMINLDEMTRDVWFSPTSIEKIGRDKGWKEGGDVMKYPSASKFQMAEKHLVEMYKEGYVKYQWARIDTKGIIVEFGVNDGSTKKMWSIDKDGIRFVLVLMSATFVFSGWKGR